MAGALGKLETKILAYTQMRGGGVYGAEELAKRVQLSKEQVQGVLSRLARDGMVARVRRGKYLLPERLPLGGKWNPSEAMALNALMDDAGAAYQICGPNAFNRYGFSEQIPNRIYVYNNRISGVRVIGRIELTLIKVARSRLGSTEQAETSNGQVAVYSSRSRTLVDAVYDWSRFGSLPEAYRWIKKELRAERVTTKKFISDVVTYGNQGTLRRIGALLERYDYAEAYLKRIERAIRSSKSRIALIPNAPRRGRVSQRWGVVLNAID